MPNPQITVSQNKLLITGELTFSTAIALWEASQKIFPQAAEWNCDFSGVQTCDSAGLALLIEWIKLSKKQGKRLHFTQIPAQLQSIAMASGLDKLLQEYMR